MVEMGWLDRDWHWCYEDTVAVVLVLMSLGVIGGLVWLILWG